VATDKQTISAAMRLLGSRKSRRKAAAARRNGRKFKGKKAIV